MKHIQNLLISLVIIALQVLTASIVYARSINRPPTQSEVRAVMFWSDTCGHCHYVLEEILPPLQIKYGDQLKITLVERVTAEELDRLYQTAEAFGIAKEQVGVPFLIIGERVLIGSEQIPAELPGLIETYLATGGVDYADLLPIASLIDASDPDSTSTSGETPGLPVVHILLFWTSDCHACRGVVTQSLPPLKEKYGERLVVQYVDIVTGEDVDRFYQVAAGFGIPEDKADLPMLIVGDHVLIGAEQIPAELSGLVEMYLATGGVDLPDMTHLAEAASSPDPMLPDQPDGFSLAIGVMVFMAVGLLYSIAAFLRGQSLLPAQRMAWLDTVFLVLALAGRGVAGYLAYVETQAVSAVCGPVGDCNAVQRSPYARIFGVLPVGVMGMLGYLAILAAWLWGRLRQDRLAVYAPVVIFGLALFGTLLSLYLTFLEPFVIKAVCVWCLTSAVIITLLMLLSLGPSLLAFRSSED